MSDLVKRLRSRTTEFKHYGPVHNGLDLEAADALEAKDAEIERLRNEQARPHVCGDNRDDSPQNVTVPTD